VIHPTAIIHPEAEVDASVTAGPYAVIDEHVKLGPDCVLGPHVHLTGWTTIGAGNRFHTGAVIGDAPQDLKYHGEPTRLRIGDRNVFREGVTVHRSATLEGETVVGSNCYLMANSHVGHNAVLGSHVILANGALLAGHVLVQDRAFISGNSVVHQFTRIGTLAIVQGGSAMGLDVPPYTIAHQVNVICGLNAIGLRHRAAGTQEALPPAVSLRQEAARGDCRGAHSVQQPARLGPPGFPGRDQAGSLLGSLRQRRNCGNPKRGGGLKATEP
jgi:UDP-N-acetylglucosamine acyltransferase